MKCVVCAIIKNEHRYLKEWIDHNFSIGFDEIFLCEDIGSESHAMITSAYTNVHVYHYSNKMHVYHHRSGAFRQQNYYDWFIANCPKDVDWCAFIDVDEFIHIDDGYKIGEFLKDYTNFNGVYLYWKFYNANGHIEMPSGSVVESYTQEIDSKFDVGWRFKSVMNMRRKSGIRCVHDVLDGVNTQKIKSKRFMCFDKAHIKHYFTKSWDDYCERLLIRGSVSVNAEHRKITDFFINNPDMEPKRKELMAFFDKKSIEIYEVRKKGKVLEYLLGEYNPNDKSDAMTTSLAVN